MREAERERGREGERREGERREGKREKGKVLQRIIDSDSVLQGSCIFLLTYLRTHIYYLKYEIVLKHIESITNWRSQVLCVFTSYKNTRHNNSFKSTIILPPLY